MRRNLLLLVALLMGQMALAQSVFSPNVNVVRGKYQTRSAASADADTARGSFVVTCGVEYSTAAIANKMIEMGAEVRALMGNMLVVDLPMSQLDAAAAIEGVLQIDIPDGGTKKTDTARRASHVNEVHAGTETGLQDLPQAYTGKGVLIGIIDSGFDFTHPMFKEQGDMTKTRIKGVYLAGDEKYWIGNTPYDLRGEGEDLNVISVTDDKGVATTTKLPGSFLTKSDVILDPVKVKDTDGSHGTHCASIAAGRIMDYEGTFKGRGNADDGKLGGMAPDAEILMAAHEVTDDEKEAYPGVTGALNYLYSLSALRNYADKEGKPLVITWSENDHEGLHDGTSTMARYIGNYCKQPGNIMALCASNEGGDDMYISQKISKGGSLKVRLDGYLGSDNVISPSADLFVKTDKAINVKLVIVDKDYNTIYECPVEMSTANPKEYYIQATLDFTNPDDLTKIEKENLPEDVAKELAKYIMGKLSVQVTNGVVAEGGKYAQIKLRCINLELGILIDLNKNIRYYPMLLITSPEEDVFLQGWAEDGRLSTNSMENPDTFTNGSAEHSVGDWCTSGEAVVIGAYITADQDIALDEKENVILKQNTDDKIGEYAKFSSYGTDFKVPAQSYPDVSAPGNLIYAAGNSLGKEAVYSETDYTGQFKGQSEPRSYPYSIMSGTSMSTPAAAGVIALWVQAITEYNAKPENSAKKKPLTNAYIKEVIQQSSTTDDFTRKTPARFGAGKINAYKGLLYILDLETAIPGLPKQHIGATLNGRTLHINGDLDTAVTVYDLSGRKVLDVKAVSGIVELPNLPAGVYAVKIGSQGSTLIRL